MNRLALKCGLTAAAGVLAAVPFAAGAVYQNVLTRRDDRELPGLGELVDVDGRKVHVRRLGEPAEGPTVVFESGLSSPLEMWSRVQAAVAEVAPTISYDRAGIGWSEPGERPRTAERIRGEFERLLEVLDVRGPLILVGHSYGGMLLRAFAQEHPDRVAGVVLVDAAHPEQLERSARQRLGLPLMRASVRSSLFWSRFGRNRLRKVDSGSQLTGLPEVELKTTIARMMTTRNWAASEAEIDAWLAHVVEEIRAATLPDGVPLFVVTADETEKADPVHGELQRELASLSAVSVQQTLPGATHLGMLCSAGSARGVTAAVLEVVDAARTGRAVKPVELVEAEPPGDQP
ncbi:alpha/beta fold hydrolase [Amycolatopsis kentuckyensis]|uniref:alpha/beta fold hydrolase n=1 Tax=Amycolatopsis kentuckyensis TaxID=218823 RepID=UPI000A372AF0|nr:alpha/beta hydrolase [Amycolatopsis kentuckyensis]